MALGDRYEHHAALYLGDIAEAENRQQLDQTKNWGIGFLQGLSCAQTLTEEQVKALRGVFQAAAKRSLARMPG
ncbi:hypothetical protein D3C76_1602650 [compost metagenome]